MTLGLTSTPLSADASRLYCASADNSSTKGVPPDTTTVAAALPDDIIDYLLDFHAQHTVWDTLSPWFEARGYFLYPDCRFEVPVDTSKWKLNQQPPKYPYAFAGNKCLIARRSFFYQYTLYPAVSKDGQDVMIKILFNGDGDEKRIARHLMSELQRSDPFNMTVPFLDVFTLDDRYSFTVMPRWGRASYIQDTGFDRLSTALQFCMCLLKALAFLHRNLIAHRDIRPANILVNFYDATPTQTYDYRPFFSSNKAVFMLCDFGLSIMFPQETAPSARLCPAEESEWGTFEYHPPDVKNGDSVYDPFAYDVACLGGLLCEMIGYITPFVPPLAPFLDRMITPDIPSRFTAPEALAAFIQLQDTIDQQCLNSPAPPAPKLPGYVWQAYDRWAGLPDDFVRKCWSCHPPVRPRRKVQGPAGSYFVDWDAKEEYHQAIGNVICMKAVLAS